MHRVTSFLLPFLALTAQPAWAAQKLAYAPVAQEVITTDAVTGGDIDVPFALEIDTVVIVVDAASGTSTKAAQDPGAVSDDETGSERLLFPQSERAASPQAIAAYGPFRVIDAEHAALVGVTDSGSPRAFAAMVRDYPGIAEITMIDCPGTEDDRANLRLGLMIHQRGIATSVPAGGFVGSGAVELFLAGTHRYADRNASFAVHSWEDDTGRQPQDYAANAPENRAYINYYKAVGMTEPEAQAFYAMTNSVPFSSAKWLRSSDMAQWVHFDRSAITHEVEFALQ